MFASPFARIVRFFHISKFIAERVTHGRRIDVIIIACDTPRASNEGTFDAVTPVNPRIFARSLAPARVARCYRLINKSTPGESLTLIELITHRFNGINIRARDRGRAELALCIETVCT